MFILLFDPGPAPGMIAALAVGQQGEFLGASAIRFLAATG
jgi:hypothetical protein